MWGLVALRLANADIFPFDFGFNGSALEQFLRELEQKSNLKSHLNLKRLHERIAQFERAGNSLRDAAARDLIPGQSSSEKVQHLNTQLLQVESNWLDPAGIPGRPWFQHLLYSSRFTYAHLEFPGLTEAVEKADWKLAAQQAVLLETALEKNTELLRSAKTSWERNNP
jgi:N-acetylated-alpha-linked acidic dipeptidase